MTPETIKEIENQLASLPKKVREVIASIDITSEIANLRVKHHLMLDQISSVELETMLAMIGLEPSENLIENLKVNAGLKEDIASALAEDINTQIFDKIRKAIREETENEENLDKDSILNEIENPTPTFRPIKTALETSVQKNTSQTNLPNTAPFRTIENYTAPSLPTKSLIEQKLSEPTHFPPKETEVFLKKLPQNPSQTSQDSQNKKTDPYKEPIA